MKSHNRYIAPPVALLLLRAVAAQAQPVASHPGLPAVPVGFHAVETRVCFFFYYQFLLLPDLETPCLQAVNLGKHACMVNASTQVGSTFVLLFGLLTPDFVGFVTSKRVVRFELDEPKNGHVGSHLYIAICSLIILLFTGSYFEICALVRGYRLLH